MFCRDNSKYSIVGVKKRFPKRMGLIYLGMNSLNLWKIGNIIKNTNRQHSMVGIFIGKFTGIVCGRTQTEYADQS